MKKIIKNSVITALFFLYTGFAGAYNPQREFSPGRVPEELKGLEVLENPGGLVDLNLEFTNSKGEKVLLKNYFDRPVLLSIVYYACPNLCGLHLNGLFAGLKDLPADFRKQFNFVLLSMDEKETAKLALAKKRNYIEKYSLSPERTHFLTGSAKNIKALSGQVGFRFRWDDRQKIFAHLPVAYVLTPKGKISRYLYGVLFYARTLRLSLVEAGQGKTGSILDKALLFCFQFDPKRRRYAWYAYNIMRAGGALTLLILFGFLIPVWIRESKKRGKTC